MSERFISAELTLGESLVIDLVNAIKIKSQTNFREGLPEDKDLDRWGEELVNSVEYSSAMHKIGQSQTVGPEANIETDY